MSDGMKKRLAAFARLRAVALACALLGGALATLACGKAVQPGNVAGETNWLQTCDEDSHCAQGSCLCGVCTPACAATRDCSGKFSGRCVETGAGLCRQAAPPAAAVCLPSCASSAECGAGYRCEQAACVPAGNADGGRSGSQAGGAPAAGKGGAGRAGAGGSPVVGSNAGGAGRGNSSGAGAGGVSGGDCNLTADCVLVATGCCAACEAHTTDYTAVPITEQAAAEQRACPGGPPACGPCAPVVAAPLLPVVRAACIQQKCTVIDERLSDEAACKTDTDCKLLPKYCCGGCGPTPGSWTSLSVETDPFTPVCTANCAMCPDARKPEAFCASDAHCAVREIARVNGELSSTCFSPTQNLEHAYDSGAVGCDCYAAGPTACLTDKGGRKVALVCPGAAAWRAVNDGSCGRMM